MQDAVQEVNRLRDLARRARRLAEYFPDDDRVRLLAHAAELDSEADKIERKLAGDGS
jgi:hypothetical protein